MALRRSHGVTEVELRGTEKLQALLDQGHGILLAPNHCRMTDPVLMQEHSPENGPASVHDGEFPLVPRQWADEIRASAGRRLQCFIGKALIGRPCRKPSIS